MNRRSFDASGCHWFHFVLVQMSCLFYSVWKAVAAKHHKWFVFFFPFWFWYGCEKSCRRMLMAEVLCCRYEAVAERVWWGADAHQHSEDTRAKESTRTRTKKSQNPLWILAFVVLAFAKRASAVTAKSSHSVWSRSFPNQSNHPFSIKLGIFCAVCGSYEDLLPILITLHAPCSVFSQTLNGTLRPGHKWLGIWYVTKKWSEKSKFIWVNANLRQHLYHSQKPTSVRPRSVVIFFFVFFFRFSLHSNNEQICRTHDIWVQVHAECVCVSMRLHSLLVLCAATFLSTLYVSFLFFFLSLLGRLESSLLLFAHAMNMWKPS